PSEEKAFADAQIEPVVRRQADLIALGPECQSGAVLSQEPGARHAAAAAPLRAKRERPRKTKRPDRVQSVTLVVIARKGETVDVVDHARVPVGVCHPSAETAGAPAANRYLDAARRTVERVLKWIEARSDAAVFDARLGQREQAVAVAAAIHVDAQRLPAPDRVFDSSVDLERMRHPQRRVAQQP